MILPTSGPGPPPPFPSGGKFSKTFSDPPPRPPLPTYESASVTTTCSYL